VNRERVTAWGRELRLAHEALRRHLRGLRETITTGRPRSELSAQLGLFCVGFCAALTRHHSAEDGGLFPRVVEEHPDLAEVIGRLKEDHALLTRLLADLEEISGRAAADELLGHLDGIEAIMESHFGYEERQLVGVLDAMTLADASTRTMLGVENDVR
jgi:hypothetical protein